MSLADAIAKLSELKAAGQLSDDEFAAAKAALLSRSSVAIPPLVQPVGVPRGAIGAGAVLVAVCGLAIVASYFMPWIAVGPISLTGYDSIKELFGWSNTVGTLSRSVGARMQLAGGVLGLPIIPAVFAVLCPFANPDRAVRIFVQCLLCLAPLAWFLAASYVVGVASEAPGPAHGSNDSIQLLLRGVGIGCWICCGGMVLSIVASAAWIREASVPYPLIAPQNGERPPAAALPSATGFVIEATEPTPSRPTVIDRLRAVPYIRLITVGSVLVIVGGGGAVNMYSRARRRALAAREENLARAESDRNRREGEEIVERARMRAAAAERPGVLRLAPAGSAEQAGSASPACSTTLGNAIHLRPTETLASAGPEFPAGTRVVVVGRGTLERNQTLMYQLRIDGRDVVGFAFLTREEIARCR